MLIAPINFSEGMVAPTSALRMPISEGRTSPITPAMASTKVGVSRPLYARVISVNASVAYTVRMATSTLRCPARSPITPNIGASSVPRCCSEANSVNISTERVSVSTYQPRMMVSISNAHDAARSAGH